MTVGAGRKMRPLRPLVDLHLHLEGSLPPATLAAMARRHGLEVPPLRAFDGFAGFLKAFGAVCDLLRDESDFETAARAVIARAGAIGVVHLEILFSPQVFARRGIPVATVLRGLLKARASSGAGAPGVVYILDGVRQWGAGWFEEILRAAEPFAGRGLAGVGIGGDERAIPSREFAGAFRRARSLGLGTTVHAGEAAGPESIREALRWLRPDRIGHGIAAAGDPTLCARLARTGVALEVCPSSNVATGVVARRRLHPVRRLFEAGLTVTIGSDDGAFFGCDVATEMRALASEHGFTQAESLQLQLNAVKAAFLPSSTRRSLERCLRLGWKGVAPQGAIAVARRARARA